MKYYLNIFIFLTLIFSQVEQPYPPLDLVTIPTSGTLPKGSFTLESLLVKDGGIIPKLSVGITDNFYIGLSYGIQDFIVTNALNDPNLFFPFTLGDYFEYNVDNYLITWDESHWCGITSTVDPRLDYLINHTIPNPKVYLDTSL